MVRGGTWEHPDQRGACYRNIAANDLFDQFDMYITTSILYKIYLDMSSEESPECGVFGVGSEQQTRDRYVKRPTPDALRRDAVPSRVSWAISVRYFAAAVLRSADAQASATARLGSG